MEGLHAREITALHHQQSLIGQLAQELHEQSDPASTAQLQNELALAGDDYVRRCNFLALELMNERQFDEAFQWLTKAERVTNGGQGVVFFEPHALLRRKALAAVHNNFGLFYFKRGEFAAARKALAQAVAEEDELGDTVADNRGGTFLNLAQAEMALRAVDKAQQTLLRAIRALEGQMEKCVVTVQIANTGLLATRAYYLLAQCLEHESKYALAADAAKNGIQMHTRLGVDLQRVAAGQQGPQRKPQLVQDLEALFHRCSEKERVFPKLLRPLSAKPIAVRSRSTPIVVTSLTEPAPQIPAQLQPSPRPTRPASGRPTTASAQRPTSTAAVNAIRESPDQPLPCPTAEATLPSTSTLAANNAEPQRSVSARNDDIIVESARQNCLRQKPAPPATRHVFRTSATGLERVYGTLSEKHKSAFDKLCATRPAAFPAAAVLTSAVSAGLSAHIVKSSSMTPRPPSMPQQSREEEAPPQPPSRLHIGKPDKQSPVPCSTPTPKGSSSSSCRAPSGALVPVTVRGVDQITLPRVQDVREAQRLTAAAILIQGSWRRAMGRQEAKALAQERRRHEQQLRDAIRREEEERAMAMATRVIEENRRRLEEQRALESNMNACSRHRSDGGGMSHSLLPSVDMLSSTVALLDPAGQQPTPSSSDVDSSGALTMLLARQHIRDSQQKVAESTHEALVRAHIARQEKRAEKKRNGSLTMQFVLGCLSTRIVAARELAKRNELLDQYGLKRRQRISARTLVRVLRTSVGRTRAREAQRRYEAEQAAIYGLALVRLFQFSTAKWSAIHVARTGTARFNNAALRLQRTFRGHRIRKELSVLFAQDQKRKRLIRHNSAKVIQRAMLRYLGRLIRNARWAAIRVHNLQNKKSYAASRIQRVWRWHAYGHPRETERQHCRLELLQVARMRLKHDQIIQELVAAAEIIQRCYRRHLGARQRELRLTLRAKQAHQYILQQWLHHAVHVLQRFCPLVVAKRAARLRREMKQYILGVLSRNERRIRGHLFPAEWSKIDAAVDLVQRVGRGSIVRRAYRRFRILSVAAFEGRLSGQAQLIARAIAPHVPSAMKERVIVAVDRNHNIPAEADQQADNRAAHSERQVEASDESSSSLDDVAVTFRGPSRQFSSAGNPGRKYRKSKRTAEHQSKPKHAMPITVSAVEAAYSQWSPQQITAKKIIVRFFRRIVAKRKLQERSDLIARSIVRNEAAVYLQSTWRGFVVRTRVFSSRMAARDESVRAQLRAESASAIQAAYRGHFSRTHISTAAASRRTAKETTSPQRQEI
jgi:tetratricopeptide (TPR) repeat protein